MVNDVTHVHRPATANHPMAVAVDSLSSIDSRQFQYQAAMPHPIGSTLSPSTFELQLLRVTSVRPPLSIVNVYRPPSTSLYQRSTTSCQTHCWRSLRRRQTGCCCAVISTCARTSMYRRDRYRSCLKLVWVLPNIPFFPCYRTSLLSMFLIVVFLRALFSVLYFSSCIPPHSALLSPHFL